MIGDNPVYIPMEPEGIAQIPESSMKRRCHADMIRDLIFARREDGDLFPGQPFSQLMDIPAHAADKWVEIICENTKGHVRSQPGKAGIERLKVEG